MTNEVTTPGAPQLPAFLQAHLAVNKPSADVASLATAQNSTPRLSLRGKVFRWMEGQEEVYKDKEKALAYIVGVEPGPGAFTKTFYINPYAGADSQGAPPDCASSDGVRPDPWIQQPQNPTCAGCPKNQFGSATSRRGRPAKACHDSKRLYLARVEEPTGKLYLNQVPVTSLAALSEYGKTLQGMGVEPWMVQTKLTMNEDAEFPELQFAVGGFIDEANMAFMKERAAKREWAVARNLMLQSQPQRPALPAHLQAALGGGSGATVQQPVVSAAAPAVNNLAPAAVDPNLVAAAQAMTGTAAAPGAGETPSNTDILKNW